MILKTEIKNKSIDSVSSKEHKAKLVLVLHECNMPLVGSWKSGDKITDPEIIKKLGDNPNFKHIS